MQLDVSVCTWFIEKLDDFQSFILNHPSVRIRALLELQ